MKKIKKFEIKIKKFKKNNKNMDSFWIDRAKEVLIDLIKNNLDSKIEIKKLIAISTNATDISIYSTALAILEI